MRNNAMGWKTGKFAALLTAAVALGGCELLYFMGGKGEQPALFDIPKTARVLVLIDLRPETEAPPTFTSTLADHISTHIYRNAGAEHMVGQDRIVELRRDEARFRKMGVADIAVATDSDIVIVVNMVYLDVSSTTDGTVIQGGAQALVKVIDRNGERLWPGDIMGVKVEAKVEAGLASDRSKAQVYTAIIDLLTVRIGRMFHPYDMEDKTMIK